MLAKSELNRTEVLIFKALISSNISRDEFLMDSVLKDYDEIEDKIEDLNM